MISAQPCGTLEPLLRTLGAGHAHPYIHDLFQTVGRLPDGRDHAVVYADLLHVVPAQLRCFRRVSSLPGALVEVVAEPAVSVHLRQCARTLEADLVHSPFGSDTALIGQVAHVFQELAEEHAGLDGTVVSRTDEARSELLRLAKAPIWPPGSAAGATTGGAAVNPTRAVRALVGAALDPEGPATVHDLVRTFAQATGSSARCSGRRPTAGAPQPGSRSSRCGSTCRRHPRSSRPRSTPTR